MNTLLLAVTALAVLAAAEVRAEAGPAPGLAGAPGEPELIAPVAPAPTSAGAPGEPERIAPVAPAPRSGGRPVSALGRPAQRSGLTLTWPELAVPAALPTVTPDAPARVTPVAAPAEPIPPGPDTWRAEALLAFQPDQTRDVACNRDNDCSTPTRSFAAGAVRGVFERPEGFSVALTWGLGHGLDQERRPRDGYTLMSLRGDVQVELGRAANRFGLALRISPVVVIGWSDTGAAARTDFPGFAVLLGTRDLWFEVGIPVLPTPVDPRFFSLSVGWRQPRFTLEGGFATFSSLTWAKDEIGRTGAGPGVWVAGRGRLAPESAWDASLQLYVCSLTSLTLSVAYRWPASR